MSHTTIIKRIIFTVLLVLPHAAFAQATFRTLVGTIISLIQAILPVVMAIAVLALFWQGTKFIWGSGDEKGRTNGRQILLWGVIAIFVMVAVWGIVELIANTFL